MNSSRSLALFADAPQFALVGREALAHPRHLAFELAQSVFGGHGLPLGLALLVFQPLQQPGQLGDIASDRGNVGFFLADGALELVHLDQHVAQLALHRERALAALFAAGDRHIVEALARLRQEKRVGIVQRQVAADLGVRNDVAVAQLGQNHFQRLAEAVEDADAILQRHHGVAVRNVICCFIELEREPRLRIFRMNQEGGASIDIAAQQAQAFIGGVPRFHDDVVQLIAQKIVDHVLVATLDFEEIGEHAHRCTAALQRSRSEQLAHGFGGIAMLGDDAFQRTFLAHQRGVLAAQGIKMALGVGFGCAFPFELLASLGDLRGQCRDALRCAFKFQTQLAALAAEAFQLLIGSGGLVEQALGFAIESDDALFSLRDAIAHARGR